ncbi:MAG TPA: bacteriocin [Xanthobacteraceae bacterium]|nr:bacteriocin [Xanthobacteraceae bacterium]
MATEKPNKHEPAKKQREDAKIAESKEISDDELKEVSGGLPSSDGTVGSGCVIS